MLEAGGLNPVLKPRAYVGEMDIAKYDSSKALRTQRTELRREPRIHLRPAGADDSEVNPGGVCLRLNHVHAGSVEANSTCDRIVKVDQQRYVHASGGRALERERTVFATGPHQGVSRHESLDDGSSGFDGAGALILAVLGHMNGISSGGITTNGRIMSRSSCSRMWQWYMNRPAKASKRTRISTTSFALTRTVSFRPSSFASRA